MPVIDDIRESKSKLEGKSFKYKLSYYWEYYRIPALVVIGVGLFLFYLIKTFVTAKDVGFEAAMMNAANKPSEEEFGKYIEMDLDKYDVIFDNTFTMNPDTTQYDEATYMNAQKLMAVVASRGIDVMVGDFKVVAGYFDSEMFLDLRKVYSDEELEAMGDAVIWHVPVDFETGEPIGENFPIAIEVTDAPKLVNGHCFFQDHVYLSIVSNSKNPEYGRSFVDFLYLE